MTKKSWNDFTPAQKAALVAAGTVQVALAATAWLDLARRSAEEVRGRKGVWALAITVNFVGPLSYFAFGRVPRTAISEVANSNTVTGTQTDLS